MPGNAKGKEKGGLDRVDVSGLGVGGVGWVIGSEGRERGKEEGREEDGKSKKKGNVSV